MKKILVVDDDPDILEAVQLILEESGFQVIGTSKGEDVVKLVSTTKPHLLILDVLLSGTDGRTIVQELQQNHVNPKPPIIMISAHPAAKTSCEALGIAEFIPKPFELTFLLDRVAFYTH